ncbi:MAG: hypothetical protein ACK5LX_03655 [Oscillospiraceae bacterium]
MESPPAELSPAEPSLSPLPRGTSGSERASSTVGALSSEEEGGVRVSQPVSKVESKSPTESKIAVNGIDFFNGRPVW